MLPINHWIDYNLRTQKTFNNHFSVNHEFHGVELSQISESYLVYPKSSMAIQLFCEGVYFPDLDINLRCKIYRSNEKIRVELHVNNPSVSKEILREIKALLLLQLRYLEKKLNTDPAYNYVKTFCKDCAHENKKPLNLCVRTCNFALKEKQKQKH